MSTARGGERDLGRIVLDKGSLIQGWVKDPEGNPVPDVEVRLGSVSGIKEVTVLQPPSSRTTRASSGWKVFASI